MIGKNIVHRVKLALTNLQVMARADVLIERNVTIKYPGHIEFGAHVTLQSGVYLYGSRTGRRVRLGDGVGRAANVMGLGEGGVDLGDHTHLGPGVVCTTQYGDSRGEMATGSPGIKTLPISVGRGCWIGSGAVLMPGTKLGDGSVVAPNSVVYGSFGAGVKLSGSPARRERVLS
jgi:acetyltransferase-like isoleucine patch superfamily enzyme